MQKLPTYCHHKAKGLAYVTVHGKVIYLGKFETETSIRNYERVIAEYITGQCRADVATVVELLEAFLKWAKQYFQKNGAPTNEISVIKAAMKKVRTFYGMMDVIDFRPSHLKALQASWALDGLSRSCVNRYAYYVKRFFKWGVENEMVPSDIFGALQVVPGLRQGRSDVRETEPVAPMTCGLSCAHAVIWGPWCGTWFACNC